MEESRTTVPDGVRVLLAQDNDLALQAVIDHVNDEIYAKPFHQIDYKWLEIMQAAVTKRVRVRLSGAAVLTAEEAAESIGWLDRMIIMTGCHDKSVFQLIKALQSHCPSPRLKVPSSATKRRRAHDYPIEQLITTFQSPPDLEQFLCIDHPFILKGYASEYKGIAETPWSDLAYLLQVAGPGRLVPVEVGQRYTDADWGQKIVKFETFLESLQCKSDDPFYLAQYDLLRQFPELRNDIIIPDYCFVERAAPSNFPSYKKPAGSRDEPNLLINAWLGPRGVVSPLHHDPYCNCYILMAGEKYIWIAPPELKDEVRPYGSEEDAAESDDEAHDSNRLLTNTSRLDPLELMTNSKQQHKHPQWRTHLLPKSRQAVLETGDLLYMPPGWWHYFRGTERAPTFGVSFWF